VKALSILSTGFLVGVLTTGCDFLSPDGAPLRYIDVTVVANGAGGAKDSDGTDDAESESSCAEELALRAELENVTSLTATSFRATAYLYAPEPQIVEWRNDIRLAPGERRVFCVDLGPAFHVVSAEPPTVDMLHIHEVSFEDGSKWRDPLAAYVWRRDADTQAVWP
jgi:hypothetical protein